LGKTPISVGGAGGNPRRNGSEVKHEASLERALRQLVNASFKQGRGAARTFSGGTVAKRSGGCIGEKKKWQSETAARSQRDIIVRVSLDIAAQGGKLLPEEENYAGEKKKGTGKKLCNDTLTADERIDPYCTEIR